MLITVYTYDETWSNFQGYSTKFWPLPTSTAIDFTIFIGPRVRMAHKYAQFFSSSSTPLIT